MNWCRLKEEGRDTTIEDAGYCGVLNPDIRCSALHLAAAEDISLRMSFCVRQVGDSERGRLETISASGNPSTGKLRTVEMLKHT